jgi:two-component system sensor histidine kinase DesK
VPDQAPDVGGTPYEGRQWDRRPTWPRAYRWVALFFIAYPLVVVFSSQPDPIDAAAALAATAIFLGLIWVGWKVPPNDPRRASWLATGGVLAILAIAVLLVFRGRHEWLAFFYYASCGASPLLPRQRTLGLITISGIAAGLTILAFGGDPGEALVQGMSVSVIGLLIFSVNETRRTNRALLAARHEVARLAVADERARIARDLHDTLGHSLSLIALKSELAGRLLPSDPARSATEIADVERVAREALSSVRETVSGYRTPTLAAELTGAREALATATIEPDIEATPDPLPPAVDAVLAWTVREAITNVVRHSRATKVRIRVSRDGDWASANITDNGQGASDGRDVIHEGGGMGLAGLSERIAALGGRLEAGSAVGGGFRLDVRLPLDPAVASNL